MVLRIKFSQLAAGFKNQPHSNQICFFMPQQSKRRTRLICCYTLMALILSLFIVACDRTFESSPPPVSNSPTESTLLNIWWDKGYVLEEDEALEQVINTWEQKSGKQVKLSFYTADEITQKAKRAIQAGNPPDVLFSSRAEYPLLAWEGKLADVSDVIEPTETLYSPAALKAAYLYNNVTKKRSYYAVPLHQATIHIFYWRDWLEQVGRSPSNIPKTWDAFWEFWKTVQNDLQSQQKQDVYGVGIPFSIGASDTYYLFEQILEAFDVQMLDQQGKLLVNDPKVRQGIIRSLDWYANFYRQAYVPPTAVKWLDPDNNRNLLNHAVVMTPNPTLSIPATLRQDRDTYLNKLGTLNFPNKPNGQPMRYIVSVRQAVIFTESKNQKTAKDFLAYLIQPETIGNYLKSAGGRYLPLMEPAWKDSFWTDPADPHISTAVKTLIQDQIRPYYTVQNPLYSVVLEENIWGKALNRMVVDNISSEQAADDAIEQINQIFKQ
jgi:multiple sugar transport system substrate-binding protein